MEIFKVGDKVFNQGYGWGEVTEVASDDTAVTPVTVVYRISPLSYTRRYTRDGRCLSEGNRALFFEELPIPESALRRPLPALEVGAEILVRKSSSHSYERAHFKRWTKWGNVVVFASGRSPFTNNGVEQVYPEWQRLD